MLKIYFKSTCATCKTALDLIKKNTDEDYELVEYLVDVPSQKEIKETKKVNIKEKKTGENKKAKPLYSRNTYLEYRCKD